MLSSARKRRFAAGSVTCVATSFMLFAPAALAVDVPVTAPVASLLPPGSAPVLTPPARIATAGCRGTAARASRASRAAVRRSVVCLINRQRASSGRRGLVADRRLTRAAARHAADMARHNYFGHVSPNGASPLRRARAAGWRGGVGEALAWGCGSLSSPAATVRAWMASPPHRAILLGRGRAIGIGFKRAAGCSGGRVFWAAEIG
ncbi:MAG: hypothetical protein QOC68_844 [Solirubrobacteraceae bacterium]|nr:hypothetical protein [Solirubrobacteraceae bacterium]